ncbi:MAG: Hsp20/alpha crystallin family protein [Myxococcota bacterium]
MNALLGVPNGFRVGSSSGPSWTEDDDGFALSVDLPGLGHDDVELTVTHRHLTLKASRALAWPDGTHVRHRERRSFEFDRTWTLPASADLENVAASFSDGVLTVRVPKTAQATPRRIEVQHG